MSDLIDREALKEAMLHEALEADSGEKRWDGGCWIRYKMFERVLASMPSAQPEQEKGKWIWADEIDSCSYTCSECSYHAYGNTGEVLCGEYKYCPHCGAKMEEELEI